MVNYIRFKLTLVFVFAYLISSAQQVTWYKFPNYVPEKANRYIYVDDNNTKWIGGYNQGLHKYSNNTWTHYTKNNSGIADNDVRQSCFDTTGNLWITTWNGLSKFNVDSNTWSNYKVGSSTYDILYSLQVDEKNRVWVGTDGGADSDDGLYMFDGSKWKFYNPLNSKLSGRWITRLRKDKTGKIWGGHYRGLFEINDTNITNHSLITASFSPNATVSDIDFDSYNNKWVSVYDGGVAKFDGSSWIIYNSNNSPLPENKVWSIAVDQNNIVWIGTENNGLVKFDGTNWTVYNKNNSIITSNRIDALNVDKFNNLWVAVNYGEIVIHSPQGISGISGYVYYDQNSNNNRDSVEPLLPNQLISIDSFDISSISNASGNYDCRILSSGNYIARVKTNSPYIANKSDSFAFAIDSVTTRTNHNFGIQLKPNITDIAVDYTPLSPPRPGFDYYCNLTVNNWGTLKADSISLSIVIDSTLILYSDSVPQFTQSGDTITWFIDSLGIFEDRTIQLVYRVPPNVNLLGEELVTRAFAYSSQTDYDSINNTSINRDVIVGAYDPNDKRVTPGEDCPSGNIPIGTEELTYTIRFQNTGTYAAENVVIKDTISTKLDLASIVMISSSHPYSAEIKNGREINWSFNNINLPDSNSNEPESHGYIKYRIKLKSGLNSGTAIKNKCYIFFDFNPPIITNQTISTLTQPVSVNVNSCTDYLLPNGVLATKSGLYNTSFKSSSGCDSMVSVNLTINRISTTLGNISACNSYSLLGSNNMYTQSGFYSDTLSTTQGCDSIVSFNLTVTHIDDSVNINGAVLTANAVQQNGATYQWVDCDDNYMPIPSAKNRIYKTVKNGKYAVIITENNCSDTSECITVDFTGVNTARQSSFKIYPNPTKGKLTIETTSDVQLSITNILGEVVYFTNLVGKKNEVNLEQLANGMYFVNIVSKFEQQTTILLIE